MTRYLLAGVATLGLLSGASLAQAATTTTTTTGNPSTTTMTSSSAGPTAVSPGALPDGPQPVGSASGAPIVAGSTTTGHAVFKDGDQTAFSGATAHDSAGGKSNTTVTNTTYPLTGMITTTRTTTNVVNGVATETVQTTNTYPPSYQRPPLVTTNTRTYASGGK